MERLPLSPTHFVLVLGICMSCCLAVMVLCIVRIRQRWRDGQEALGKLHENARAMHLEMEVSQGTTSGAEPAAKTD